MSYSVLQAKADLTSVLHGTTLDSINDIDGLFNRVARQLLLDIDFQETKRIQTLASPIFNQVWDYALPNDLKGNRIIDIRPQVNRQSNDITAQVYERPFDLNKFVPLNQDFTIQFNTGLKTIRINRSQSPIGVVINDASSITSNGTWSTFGDASNLTVDNVNYATGSSSLKFDLVASGSFGGLVNSTMTAVNLTAFLNQSSNFLYAFLPTASDFSSIVLRWGSSASNYYEVSTTVTQANTALQNGWNLLQYLWSNATTTGTPDTSAINYIRVGFNYNGTAQTAVHLDNIVNRMGQIMEIVYYSKFMFRDAITGAFQETVTDDSNLINLDTESYNIFLNQLAYLATQQQQGLTAVFGDQPFFYENYQVDKTRYQALYKSEVSLPVSTYYKLPKAGYNRIVGNRRFNY